MNQFATGKMFVTVARSVLAVFMIAGCCASQTVAPKDKVLPAKSCLDSSGNPLDLEHPPQFPSTNPPYTVSSSKVDNPFDFLPWVHAQDQAAAQEISSLVDHQPFTYDKAIRQALEKIEAQGVLPQTSGFKVKIVLEIVSAFCTGTNVDLVYHVYSSQVAPDESATPEAQATARKTPQNAAGVAAGSSTDTVPIPATLVPTFGFDSTDKLYAGGDLTLSPFAASKIPVQFTAEGQGSQAMWTFHAALSTSQNSLGPIMRSVYQLNYNQSALPTGVGAIQQAQASLQYTGTSRPFLKGNVSARFGGLAGKGDAQALLRLPAQAGASTASAVNALKLYGGLDSRFSHNVVAASFGLELGTAKIGDGFQWEKYVGDVHHDFWHTLGDHHTFDLDSRLTVGRIDGGSAIPIAERFFGGNYEQSFMPNDAWRIRANPVIRAIPGSRFFQTAQGAGADRFFAYNLTAALSAWQKPLVPAEVRNNHELTDLLNGQITTATSIEQNYYAMKDPNYGKIVAELPVILSTLQALGPLVAAAQAAHTGQAAAQFKACASAVRTATSRTKSAAGSSGAQQYDRMVNLLTISAPQGEDRLTKVIASCDQDLNSALGPPKALDLTAVIAEQTVIEADFEAINNKAAEAKADADMLIVRRTLDTLFKEINLISVSPVFVFDIAKIGPAGPLINGTRYGPGGGMRLELANSVNFTFGYARDVNPGPGEGQGAFFFSMGVRDLFH